MKKPKFEIGERVNFLPGLSGLTEPLIVASVKWDESDQLSEALGVEFQPKYVYSFVKSNLSAYENQLDTYVEPRPIKKIKVKIEVEVRSAASDEDYKAAIKRGIYWGLDVSGIAIPMDIKNIFVKI